MLLIQELKIPGKPLDSELGECDLLVTTAAEQIIHGLYTKKLQSRKWALESWPLINSDLSGKQRESESNCC